MVRLLVLIGLALISIPDTAAASRREALVVGAAEYAHAPGLAHTLNDARDVAAALTRLDFEVDLVLNPDRTARTPACSIFPAMRSRPKASIGYCRSAPTSRTTTTSVSRRWILP
jgi:hypothetical protein